MSILIKSYSNRGNVKDVEYIECVKKISKVKLNVYTYFQDGVLIDSGAYALRKFIKPFVDSLPIERAVITHTHEDHDGCAQYLQQKGINIYVNEMSIARGQNRADYLFYRKFFWGIRPPYDGLPLEETFESRRYKWRVIPTPGHAADHVVFLNESTGQLFSGDLYVTSRTKLILREESIPTIIRSIDTVLHYDFEEMFCNHAGYIKDGRKALETKREYLLEVTDRVQELAKQGYSVDEINNHLFPRKYPIIKFSCGEWHSKNIVKSILSEQ